MGALDRDPGDERARCRRGMPIRPSASSPTSGGSRTRRRRTIAQWVECGAPEGNPKDLPRRPEYPRRLAHWSAGRRPRRCRRTTRFRRRDDIPYLYFEVPANFDEDRWMQSWEMRPGNPAVSPPRHRLRAHRQAAPPAAGPPGTPRPPAGVRPLPRAWTFPPDRPADLRCPRISASRRIPTIAPARGGRQGRSAAMSPATRRGTSPTAPRSGCPTARRSSSRCTTRPIGEATTDRTQDGSDLRERAAEAPADRHGARSTAACTFPPAPPIIAWTRR